MHCLLIFQNIFVGIVTALPRSKSASRDNDLQRRQVNACVGFDSNGLVQQCSQAYVDSTGRTVIEDSQGTLTLPIGSTGPLVATYANGQSTTVTLSEVLIQTSDESGNTVFSNADSIVTIPSGLSTTLETILPNGDTTVVTPQRSTDILTSQSAATTATAATSEVPDATVVEQTTVSEGQTLLSFQEGTITLPTGVTTPIETTLPNGESTIISFPTTTSPDPPGGFIFPVTTSVPEPKPTDGGTVIPCNLWFFSLCIQWEDLNVFGWRLDLPPGIYPPGPPPPITIDPKLSITLSVKGKLPEWPTLTIGPDRLPTYEPKPDNCETETAELCATSTSYEVSPSGDSTVTTASSVLSTCATVYGCNLRDESTQTTRTSTCAATTCASCPVLMVMTYDDSETGGLERRDAALPGARHPHMQPTETATTLRKRYSRVSSHAEAPAVTTPPLDYASHTALRKRLLPDTRSSAKLGNCQLNQPMTFLKYLDLSDFPAYPDAESYYLLSQRSAEAGTCYAGYVYSTDDYTHASKTAGVPPYMNGGRSGRINADHVYEQSLFGSFFAYALSIPGALDCSEFNKLFVDTGRLQHIFDASIACTSDNGANVNHPDFVAMDVAINEIKANFFKAENNLVPLAPGAYASAVERLQGHGMAADLIGFEQVITVFRRTHERLYQLFGEIDYQLAACNEDGALPTWAATYSEWMTEHLSSRAAYITNAASTWYSILSAQPANAQPYVTFTQLALTYPPEAYGMPTEAMGSGLKPFTPPAAAKRQDACTLQHSPSGSDTASSASGNPVSLTDLPALSTGIITPSGSSCISTFIQTQCALGGGGRSACVSTPACGSWTATEAATTSTASESTSTPAVRVEIYKNDGCTDLVDTIEFNAVGICYKPSGEFKCFTVTSIDEESVSQGRELTAFKGAGCFSLDETDREVYTDLEGILDTHEKPFKMGSMSLNTRDI